MKIKPIIPETIAKGEDNYNISTSIIALLKIPIDLFTNKTNVMDQEFTMSLAANRCIGEPVNM